MPTVANLVARRSCCCARCIAASEDGTSAAETHADLVEHAARVESLPQFIGIWKVMRGQPLANQRYATGNSVADGRSPNPVRQVWSLNIICALANQRLNDSSRQLSRVAAATPQTGLRAKDGGSAAAALFEMLSCLRCCCRHLPTSGSLVVERTCCRVAGLLLGVEWLTEAAVQPPAMRSGCAQIDGGVRRGFLGAA